MNKPTKEQIEQWKATYGTVYRISVEGREAYLKPPGRKTIGYASVAGKNNPIKFNEIILNDCWLGGDEEIKTNDILFLSVSAQLAELIQIKEAELVKL
ncbi:MAG: hypothetical protein LUG18_15180 [Candidatus Azobacteroides sp.]|nr:hypothetical protein [Candidatus Azobacteroides sp.]